MNADSESWIEASHLQTDNRTQRKDTVPYSRNIFKRTSHRTSVPTLGRYFFLIFGSGFHFFLIFVIPYFSTGARKMIDRDSSTRYDGME